MTPKIIAIANQKGGVAKTTSAIALGGLLAEKIPCLLVDLDPQGNLTTGLGLKVAGGQLTTYEVITRRCSATSAIVQAGNNLGVIPADILLAQGDPEIQARFEAHFYLKEQLEEIKDFPVILIDCPPSLSIMVYNALVAANLILIPVQCEFLAVQALLQLLPIVSEIKKRANPGLEVLGLLPTMAQNTEMTRDVLANLSELSEQQGFTIFPPVPRSVNFSYSTVVGKPIHAYSKDEKLIASYRAIAKNLFTILGV